MNLAASRDLSAWQWHSLPSQQHNTATMRYQTLAACIVLAAAPSSGFVPNLKPPVGPTRSCSSSPTKTTILTSSRPSGADSSEKSSFIDKLASTVSQTASMKANQPYIRVRTEQDRKEVQLKTLLRVSLPSVIAGVIGFLAFPPLALHLASLLTGNGVLTVLSTDSSQFVQNFLTVSGLLFSILVGQT